VIGVGADSNTIVVCDCSPFPALMREEDDWLRRLVTAVRPAEVLFRFGSHLPGDEELDDEPLATFDSASSTWWAGRYIGELEFEGRTLRLEPRFGMPRLLRWLSTIWGVKIFESTGAYRESRIWLWLIIAHLWAGRLIAGAKHGLPTRRVDNLHRGRSARGRLVVRKTALERAAGTDQIVSVTRVRSVDAAIGGIVLSAFRRLEAFLEQGGVSGGWLPDRGRAVIDQLRNVLDVQIRRKVETGRTGIIRYSPITESYRPVVDLSVSILDRRPLMPGGGDARKAIGIVLDMAEIWELYVAKVLQRGLDEFRVEHVGRSRSHVHWLLGSAVAEDKFGSLRPDLIVSDHLNRCRAIVDAKYKTTRARAGNLAGVAREDLYQIAAYVSGFGVAETRLDGFLVYPGDKGGEVDRRLAPRNPWRLGSAPRRNLWFLSLACEGADDDPDAAAAAERRLATLVAAAINQV
jgi:5-methylcytosine-specific restriction enzyme subunit McrC